jgi:hypothetical protein
MTLIEAAQKALEALKAARRGHCDHAWADEAMSDLRTAIAEAEKQEPVAWMTINAYGEEDDIHYDNPEGKLLEGWTYKPLYTHPQQAKQASVKMRRGDILRCIETDELCTVWATSTTGKTMVKWSANHFGDYTAEQIGELFWIEPDTAAQREPMPDDLILSYDKGFKDGAAQRQPLTEEPPCPTCEALARTVMLDQTSHDTTPQHRAPLTDEAVMDIVAVQLSKFAFDTTRVGYRVARAVEAAHGIKEKNNGN